MGAGGSAETDEVVEPCALLAPCRPSAIAHRYDKGTETWRTGSLPFVGAAGDDCSEEMSTCSTTEPKDHTGQLASRTLLLDRRSIFAVHTRAKFHEHYRLEHLLGEGMYGDVFEATCTPRAQQCVAAKCFPRSQSGRRDSLEHMQELATKNASFEQERSIFAGLEHPNIVKMFEAFEEPDRCWIVMELCRGGELYERIADRAKHTGRGLDEPVARTIFRQALQAVAYLHGLEIVHRDLKTENLLLVDAPGGREQETVKLCDFGTAVRLTREQPRAMDPAGTLSYTAPEVFHRLGAALPADVWSMGVVLYAMLVGLSPFRSACDETAQDVVDRAASGHYDVSRPVWRQLSASSHRLVARLIVVDERSRIPCAEALRDPWVVSQAPWHTAVAVGDSSSQRVLRGLRQEDGAEDHASSLARHSRTALALVCHFARLDFVQQLLLVLCARLTADAELLAGESALPMQELFFALDADGDGRICVREFASGIKALLGSESRVPEERLLQLAQAMDLDASGAIDWAEWMALALIARPRPGEELAEPLRAALRGLDRPTGDGFIGVADLLAVTSAAGAASEREAVAQAMARWAAGGAPISPTPGRHRGIVIARVGDACGLDRADLQAALRAALASEAVAPQIGRAPSVVSEDSLSSGSGDDGRTTGFSRRLSWFACCQDDDGPAESIHEEWLFVDSPHGDHR